MRNYRLRRGIVKVPYASTIFNIKRRLGCLSEAHAYPARSPQLNQCNKFPSSRIMPFSTTTVLSLGVLLLVDIASCMPPKCRLGQFLQNNECKDCPPGTYQDKTGATSCTPCPPGTYNPFQGAQGGDICINCPVGTFRSHPGAALMSDCKKCPKGRNAPPGSSSCTSCPPGKRVVNCKMADGDDFLEMFSGQCFVCTPGNVASICRFEGPTKVACEDCQSGSFSNKPNAVQCEECRDGLVSNDGATECKPKPSCPPGSTSQFTARCEKCRYSTYNDGTFDDCKTCPPGSIGEKRNGSTKCVLCPAGTFKKDRGDIKCRRCRPGQNSFVTGAQYCVNDNYPCPPNFFRSSTGACLTCTVYERYNKIKNRCEACPRNSLSEGGISAECKFCGPGTRTKPEQEFPRCICMEGFGFVPGSGATKCQQCPPGTASGDLLSNPAPVSCIECREGTFAPRAGMALCMPCPEGFSQPLRGQTKCVRTTKDLPCPDGLTRNTNLECVDPKTNCPPQTQRLKRRDFFPPACTRRLTDTCPAGTVLMFTYDAFGEQLGCEACPEDTRYIPSEKECRSCEINETSPGGDSQTCTPCPAGEVSRGNGCVCLGVKDARGQCTPCPPGTFQLSGTDGCAPCPVGTFTDRASSEVCENCRAGFFTDTSGQSTCKRCPKGLVSSGIGDSGCVRPRTRTERKDSR